ncbi:hypothetical protein B0J13DRAFT_225088 [Dactylonectria estremocensis]|uniref:UDP-glycosyltransferases domain-containing protein n=1 Tax=Dactylonectria estremocensis TaxID=1079267 RepID=A0A9P9J981_9HYPO|nr:hypothetical protein B0J13DRAFT_225088 [Dactylonectria estremocensis]
MADLEAPRRILLLVTTGGFTHAAPVLEIGAVLASRGHEIQFATNAGQEGWTSGYPFIETVHTTGPAAPEDEMEAHYDRMRVWRPEHGFAPMMKSKYLFDRFWADAYRKLKELCADETTRPGIIVADFFAEHAARDMLHQFNVQVACVWPQMPYGMAPCSYHPGQPGFQLEMTVTSEHASLASRFRNELVLACALPELLYYIWFTKRMRKAAGVEYKLPIQTKPDYLVLVNSFFGLEAPKELPPLMAAVGPILADAFPPLDDDLSAFLESHDKTIYLSLGTHICLPANDIDSIITGLLRALDAGHINGVIWAVPRRPRANFDPAKTFPRTDGSTVSVADLLGDEHPDFRLPVFAPQRAVLAHVNTVLFLTHGGGSSANEALFHGVPVFVVGYFFDQLCNSARLIQAGVGLSLDKGELTPGPIAETIAAIRKDADGSIARNVRRIQRIAHIASRRKYLAADLIEEVMADQELRFQAGVEKRPMHLQTADVRMPLWKARNWDMWLITLTALAAGGLAGRWMLRGGWKRLPAVLCYSVGIVKGYSLI